MLRDPSLLALYDIRPQAIHTGSGDQYSASGEATQITATGEAKQYVASGPNSKLIIYNCTLRKQY